MASHNSPHYIDECYSRSAAFIELKRVFLSAAGLARIAAGRLRGSGRGRMVLRALLRPSRPWLHGAVRAQLIR
jgi:hypothetical protein